MADHGRVPDLAMIVGVEKAFFHCGECITRSSLWSCKGCRAQAADWTQPLRAMVPAPEFQEPVWRRRNRTEILLLPHLQTNLCACSVNR